MRNARTFARRSRRYVTSGTTRSMPYISSSGNIRPQSMTTMSSPYSTTYMFLPISPTPPSGMILSGVSPGSVVGRPLVIVLDGSEQGGRVVARLGKVAGRKGCRGRPGGRGVRRGDGGGRVGLRCGRSAPATGLVASGTGLAKDARQRGDVVVALALDIRAPERGRRVEHRERQGVARAGR